MEWAGPLLSLLLRMWLDEKGPSGEPRTFYFRDCLSKRIQFQSRRNQMEELSEYDEEQLEQLLWSVRHTSFTHKYSCSRFGEIESIYEKKWQEEHEE